MAEENRIDYESKYKRANEENRKLSDELTHQKRERALFFDFYIYSF